MKEYFNKLYAYGFNQFQNVIYNAVSLNHKMFIVTANPETFMIGQKNSNFDKVLKKNSTTIVPDGIGVVKAARYLSFPIKEKITGVEITACLLKIADQQNKGIYLYGAKENVIQTLVQKIKKEYPHITISGFHNGYDEHEEKVFQDILHKEPDIVLVALGIPHQELLIDKYYEQFKKGIFIGVGGSFDVISGCKKRAPKIFIKLNLEWLYRIFREPKRLRRFYKSNVLFISKIRKIKKENGDQICQSR